MADESKPATTSHAKAASPVAGKPTSSAFAFREMKLRDGMIARLKEFKPEGGNDSAQLEIIRAAATGIINSLAAEVNAVELMIEFQSNPGAVQLNLIVFPKKL